MQKRPRATPLAQKPRVPLEKVNIPERHGEPEAEVSIGKRHGHLPVSGVSTFSKPQTNMGLYGSSPGGPQGILTPPVSAFFSSGRPSVQRGSNLTSELPIMHFHGLAVYRQCGLFLTPRSVGRGPSSHGPVIVTVDPRQVKWFSCAVPASAPPRSGHRHEKPAVKTALTVAIRSFTIELTTTIYFVDVIHIRDSSRKLANSEV
jgi:hypothetical protein